MKRAHSSFIFGLIKFFVFFYIFSFFSSAFSSEDIFNTYMICRNKKMIRTIRVGRTGENKNRCETVYTKSGVDRSVGSGMNASSCRQFANNIRRNLEEASWRCQDITAKASMSYGDSQNSVISE